MTPLPPEKKIKKIIRTLSQDFTFSAILCYSLHHVIVLTLNVWHLASHLHVLRLNKRSYLFKCGWLFKKAECLSMPGYQLPEPAEAQ